MKFEDIFKLNLRCWKKVKYCFKCEKTKVCMKLIEYDSKRSGYDPF